MLLCYILKATLVWVFPVTFFFFFLRGKSGTIDKDTKGVPCMSKKQKFTWEDHTERFSRYFPMREDDLEKNT